MQSELEKAIKQGKIRGEMTFNQKVWTLTAQVPKGKVTTYGELARQLGTQAYRAVGNAMNKNPYAPKVPCHRVVGSDGSLTGFASGVARKKKLLTDENIEFNGNKVNLDQLYTFK